LSTVFFPGQDRTKTIYEKDAFWVLNTRYDVLVGKGWTAYLAVNNLFNLNQHPTFIAIDEIPCRLDIRAQNGACGTSMPGREIVVGLQGRW
jgi:vitamin B12 transporter